jgi:uncharacterized OB-fold protein
MEPFNLQFPFTRTLGSTLSTFFSALAKGQIIGVRVGDRVIAPPLEYDPETAADAGSDWVKVGPKGTVSSWTWVPEPTHLHPLQEPFGFAFITLDGADTPMIHLVQASEDQLKSGLRVEAQFKPEGEANGRIDDIVAFVPASDPAPSVGAGEPFEAPAENEIENMDSYCDLVYIDNASPSTRLWMDALMGGKLIGQVCPVCNRTYVGPRGLCCVDAVELDDTTLVEVFGKGVVANFTVITPTPYPGQLESCSTAPKPSWASRRSSASPPRRSEWACTSRSSGRRKASATSTTSGTAATAPPVAPCTAGGPLVSRTSRPRTTSNG